MHHANPRLTWVLSLQAALLTLLLEHPLEARVNPCNLLDGRTGRPGAEHRR